MAAASGAAKIFCNYFWFENVWIVVQIFCVDIQPISIIANNLRRTRVRGTGVSEMKQLYIAPTVITAARRGRASATHISRPAAVL